MSTHPQADLMRVLIERQEIRALYHFTDIDNLPLIARLNGLRSKEFLESNTLLGSLKTGGNELSRDLDVHWNNWDKVSLSWCAKLPMAYIREQQQHLCYIIVDKEVALQQGVIFTDRNAVDNNQHRGQGVKALEAVDFTAVKKEHPYPSPEVKKRKQAEILTPYHVPLTAIRYIVFRSESSRVEAERICYLYPEFRSRFTVASRLFHLPSSYVKTHLLTSAIISRESIGSISERGLVHETNFTKSVLPSDINLVISVYGTTGANLTTRFSRENGQIVSEAILKLPQTGDFWAWSTESISSFQPGGYQVECYLSGNSGDIKQLITPFSIAL